MLLGLLMLVLADIPRRALRRLSYASPGRYKGHVARGSQRLTKSIKEDVAWGTGWLLGR
jgi:hypothetical protein